MKCAFTLVELLIAVAIIAILIGLLLPAIQSAREAGRRAVCASNMRGVALAMQNYHHLHYKLPIGIVAVPRLMHHGVGGGWPGHTAFAQILPFIEGGAIMAHYDFTKRTHHPDNNVHWDTVISVYRCPSDAAHVDGFSNVVACFGTWNMLATEGSAHVLSGTPAKDTDYSTDGAFQCRYAKAFAKFKDGTSNTVMLSEVRAGGKHDVAAHAKDQRGWWHYYSAGGSWYTHKYPPNTPEPDVCFSAPHDTACIDQPEMPAKFAGTSFAHFTAAARSQHPAGVNVALADGSVRFVENTIDPTAWKAAATIAGNDKREW